MSNISFIWGRGFVKAVSTITVFNFIMGHHVRMYDLQDVKLE